MYNVVNSWVAFFALSCHNYKKPPHSPTPHAPINRQSNPTLLTVISTPLLPSILGFSASPSLFISSFLPPFIHNLLLYNTIQLDSNFNFQFNFCYQKPTLDFFSFLFLEQIWLVQQRLKSFNLCPLTLPDLLKTLMLALKSSILLLFLDPRVALTRSSFLLTIPFHLLPADPPPSLPSPPMLSRRRSSNLTPHFPIWYSISHFFCF